MPAPSLVRISSRFLIPFFIEPENPLETIDQLVGRAARLDYCPWFGFEAHPSTYKAAHSQYFTEYLPHVHKFLFDSTGNVGCHYLKLPSESIAQYPADADVWLGKHDVFNRTDLPANRPSVRGLQPVGMADAPGRNDVWRTPEPFHDPARQTVLQAHFQKDFGAELWVSQLGVGILSFWLQFDSADPDRYRRDFQRVSHALATAQHSVWLKGHVAESDEASSINLHREARSLLEPFRQAGGIIECEQRGLVFHALEFEKFEPGGEGTDDQIADTTLDTLSHFAQLHLPSHPGEFKEHRHCTTLMLNREHVCAASLSGAAHATFASDQDRAEKNYSAQRLRRVQMVYFPGFLLAVLQRLCLQRILNKSTQAAHDESDTSDIHEEVYGDVLKFGLEGEFVQVSWRGGVQEHHELAQSVSEVPEGLRAVRTAVSEFQAHEEEQRSERRENAIHGLEVFIVSFYSFKLAYYLAKSFKLKATPALFGGSLAAVAILSALASIYHIWRRERSSKRFSWDILGISHLLAAIALIHILFWAFHGAIHWIGLLG